MPIGNNNIHKQTNVTEFIKKLILICVFWIESCSEMKWIQIYYFSTIIISNSQIETPISYSRSKNVNINMPFTISNFEGNLVLMCLASHFDIIASWKLIVGHRVIYYAKKILNSSLCMEVRILVEKWNECEVHIFPKPLLQTWRLETTSLCLNNQLLVKNIFIFSLFLLKFM